MKPTSYRVQNGCHSCNFVSLESEIDCRDKWFCEYEEPWRVWHNKMPSYSDNNYYLWREIHEVQPHGICKYWQESL